MVSPPILLRLDRNRPVCYDSLPTRYTALDALQSRTLYCPSHFGNTYECALDNEISDLLHEAKHWGFNRYADWFDTIDLYDLYARSHRFHNMPEAVWARKFSNFACAAAEELDLGLVVTPNHVFSDQVTDENRATAGDRYFGQLVCPSKPGVTDMILGNYRNIFRDFAQRGLELSCIAGGAYDYGGCACQECAPWITAFGRLFLDIWQVAREHFPAVQANLWAWWWSDEDHRQFSDWADREATEVFGAVAFHLPYGTSDYQARPIPRGASEQAFVHIGYGERSNRDAYTHCGANIAAQRLERTVRYLDSRGATGFLAYSEGANDDINKALLGGLASSQYANADELLAAYAERYFGPSPDGWSELLRLLGDFESIDVKRCRPLFSTLERGARPGWRLEQIRGRLEMAEASQAVANNSAWDARRRTSARTFIDVKQRLYRDVWRLGLPRHIFRFDSYMPEWYDEYAALEGAQALPGTGSLHREA